MKKLQTKAAALMLGLTPDMIRKMEIAGVLRAEKTSAGTRLFDAEEVQRVKAERAAKKRK